MAKYINTVMAIEALQKGLDVWAYSMKFADVWGQSSVTAMTNPINSDYRFAIGEKPTSPPRKMIEIDGVVMPAPIMREEEVTNESAYVGLDGVVNKPFANNLWTDQRLAFGSVYATEADAIAARDARKLILERAMERAK